MKEDKKDGLCFPSMIAKGEHKNGFNAYTPNGVSRDPEGCVKKDNYGNYEDGSHNDWEILHIVG